MGVGQPGAARRKEDRRVFDVTVGGAARMMVSDVVGSLRLMELDYFTLKSQGNDKRLYT